MQLWSAVGHRMALALHIILALLYNPHSIIVNAINKTIQIQKTMMKYCCKKKYFKLMGIKLRP
jgi:hypothetical protein